MPRDKDNKEKTERCINCLRMAKRKEMKHVQTGFSVVWKHKKNCKKVKL